ncbi:MAG: thioesterase family protein [Anaerolineales bacterium]|nr:thioesterase family protein [Anaerolineales bacterium]
MDYSAMIPVGLRNEAIFVVEEQYTAAHIGSGSLRVLATPSMIGMMERVSHALIAQQLPEGYSSVGTLVNVQHLAPTPMNARVRVLSQVVEVDGRKVTLHVEAWDDQEKVGEGQHQRVIIEVQRFLQRVTEKQRQIES